MKSKIQNHQSSFVNQTAPKHQGHLVLRVVEENRAKEWRCMIAEANVRSMKGLKCAFMGFSFSSADAFRRSLIGKGRKRKGWRTDLLLEFLISWILKMKIDLRRLFVSVIDHTTGPEHQLLFFKERFLPKDHPDRPKMDRFSAKLRKLGLCGETIGYGPTKEKWEAFLKLERGIHPA